MHPNSPREQRQTDDTRADQGQAWQGTAVGVHRTLKGVGWPMGENMGHRYRCSGQQQVLVFIKFV